MTKVTTFSGWRAYRASAATAPTSSSGAWVRSQRPSARSSRLPARTFSRTCSITTAGASRRHALALPDLEHVVERIALHRGLAGVTDDAEQLRPRQAGRGLGPRHVLHALVLEGAVHVVGAEVERDRRGFLTQEHPVRLDVREVVEEQPCRGDGSQILRRRRRPRHQARRPHLIRQRDEGEEPAGRVLLRPEPEQMIDPLGSRLDVAVEHGRVGPDAERVGDAVDLAPAVAVGLAGVAELLRQPGGADLGAAAGHRLQARRLEARQRLARLDLPAPPEVVDLGGGEGLDLHGRPCRVEPTDHPLVVLEGPVRMVATDDVHLADLVADHADDVLERVLEGPGLALLAREAAEGAREHADVRRRDVPVEDEVDTIALAPAFGVIGHPAQAEQVLGLEQEEPVITVEAATRPHLVPDGIQPHVAEAQRATSGNSLSRARLPAAVGPSKL